MRERRDEKGGHFQRDRWNYPEVSRLTELMFCSLEARVTLRLVTELYVVVYDLEILSCTWAEFAVLVMRTIV